MYIIYDTETTGLLQSFDQITEFAALVLDEEGKVLDKLCFDVSLTRDSIPAIEALRVVHRLPSHSQGLREPLALEYIHKLLSSCPWNGGYNTLRFDDELLRFSFYRHGFAPYAHQSYPKRRRFDLLPVVALFYVIHEPKLTWPRADSGRITLRLEALNQSNAWKSGQAHEALFDVEVTAALFSTLKAIDGKLFDYAFGYFDKKLDEKRSFSYLIKTNDEYPWAYMLDARFGSEHQFVQAYEYLGPHPTYANQTVWRNRAEPERILRKKWGEAPFVLAPSIEAYLHSPSVTPSGLLGHTLPEFAPCSHVVHPEADLYTGAWTQNSIEVRQSSAVHRWRYGDYEDDNTRAYRDYLCTGVGEVPYDHLKRARRHLGMIDAAEISAAPEGIRQLYAAIQERLSD